MNFATNHIKVKSNWFEKEGLFSNIEHDGLLLYLNLYRYHIANQEQYTFATSLKQLRKGTGFTKIETLNLFKRLIKYKVISCSVTRWDRHNENDFMIVSALDIPQTERIEKNGKMVDKPLSDDDLYISVDMRLMQHYLSLGFDGREIGLCCLVQKLSHNTEGKAWMTINSMAEILGLSNDKVNKMIHQLNRNYLMYSDLRKNGHIVIEGKKKVNYRYEHRICHNINHMKAFNTDWIKAAIDKNIAKWDKKNAKNRIVDVSNEDDFVLDDLWDGKEDSSEVDDKELPNVWDWDDNSDPCLNV
ncbi:hypothetical protein [Paenibacillus spongiae]|uniref:Helix-turn-helix domain-containing protein n=1 Tax=Paenibacillus spongiae TaxID=2909671 RepID=A0ABY5SHE7_9BACL|nr:hypothetical protein [Paenibacillus spongiae]UVI32073.1 hypothetical protein L1F29_09750 [Paenibacillus spongiae]